MLNLRSCNIRNWLVVGLLLGSLVSCFWQNEEHHEARVEVAVRLERLPEGLIVTGPTIKALEVRLRGPQTAIETFAASRPVYRVDLQDASAGTLTVGVDTRRLELPPTVEVLGVSSSTLHIKLQKTLQKEVPVVVTLNGAPAQGFVVTAAVTQPATVVITGPELIVAPLTALPTRPIDVGGLTETLKKEVALELADGLQVLFPKTVITAEITVAERIVTRKLTAIPVQARNASAAYRITPATIDLEVRGPAKIVARLPEGESFMVYVDLAGLAPGVYARRVTIGLPIDTTLVGVSPEVFTVDVGRP